jgi:hypothetical protein
MRANQAEVIRLVLVVKPMTAAAAATSAVQA